MTAYYNEIEPFAAERLRRLIEKGLIAPGDVDERDIRDVTPAELVGYSQCHFFAGIGGWSRALRLAGWPDDRPVWTGSCPCQGFSAAGRGRGFADERHLWPYWFHLIRVCRPPVVFGEQVASKLALSWLDLVQDDLEGEGYACGAADLCAASVGAPHIRQRLWFVAQSKYRGCPRGNAKRTRASAVMSPIAPDLLGNAGHPGLPLCEREAVVGAGRGSEGGAVEQSGEALGPLANTDVSPGERSVSRPSVGAVETSNGGVCTLADSEIAERGRTRSEDNSRGRTEEVGGPGTSFWTPAVWLPCRDGKWRPTKPGLQPLAHGVSGRVGRLRAYGNAIVPEVAAEFIRESSI